MVAEATNNKAVYWILSIILFNVSAVFILSCSDPAPGKKNGLVIPDSSAIRGKILAVTWCGSCHALPDPSLLDKTSWEKNVLPYMGLWLGILSSNAVDLLPAGKDIDPDIFPARAMIGEGEWKDIMHYYTTSAPDSLSLEPAHQELHSNLALFETSFTPGRNDRAAACLVKIDTSLSPHQLLYADAFGKMYRYDPALQLIDSAGVPGPVVDISWTGRQKLYTNVGSINPDSKKTGSVGVFYFRDSKPEFHTLFDTLARPTQTIPADLNKDGKMDYLICEFGYFKGSVAWMEDKGKGTFEKHILLHQPGAINAYIKDDNHDGWPDIWVLLGQGEEGIFLLTNKGSGAFESKEVLRFPPVYGSSGFELQDFNMDGYEDILYTCGDNADITPVLKPYHGVYLFLNNGSNHFTQSYFYPLHGCYKAMAADFDRDGDLDIATISFFADYINHPETGFVYFENKGASDFQPYMVPETMRGRWVSMDIGDLDNDGKMDIALSNYAAPLPGVTTFNKWDHSPSILVLRNRGLKNNAIDSR